MWFFGPGERDSISTKPEIDDEFPKCGRVLVEAECGTGFCDVLIESKNRTRAGVVEVETVAANTARKLVLGKVPKKDVKAHVRETLLSMGMPRVWTDDEMDAFVAANWLRHVRGAWALTADQKGKAA
jgi:hypothetical protein